LIAAHDDAGIAAKFQAAMFVRDQRATRLQGTRQGL
jgi:hypothetical protein